MVNDENNGTASVDEGGGESFSAAFNDNENQRLDAALPGASNSGAGRSRAMEPAGT